jgi:rare lipoprotein A
MIYKIPGVAAGARWLMVAALAAGLGACAETEFVVDSTQAVTRSDPTGGYKVGDPYQINGVWYYPAVDYEYDETGIASWYGPDFHGRATANGELYDMNGLTAAHRTLPLPSLVRITNLENGRAMNVRVNDRGPFAHGRIIDVSRRDAQLLGFEQQGTARVRVEILADESRAIAAAAQGGAGQLAEGEPVPAAAPSVTVTAEALPPPGATAAAPTPAVTISDAPAPSAVQQIASAAPILPDGQVSQVPVKATAIYVQAGAFTDQYNATRLKAQLQRFGAVRIVPVVVDGQQFYRVRVGPLASVEQADGMLGQIVQAGHPEARLVVE